MRFSGKIALITGGSQGIGFASAGRLALEGAEVLLLSRNPERGDAACRAIVAAGGKAAHFVTDIGDPASVEATFAQIKARYGRLDIAVNNAAAGFRPALSADLAEAEVEALLAVDLKGLWRCLKAEIGLMAAGGAIVNLSSVNGLSGTPGASLYSAAKHGVIGLTRSAAREYIGQGIRINAVCPGPTDTPRRVARLEGLAKAERDAAQRQLAEQIPAGRAASAEEIAAGIVWLCSDESSYVVGHALVMDGGLSA